MRQFGEDLSVQFVKDEGRALLGLGMVAELVVKGRREDAVSDEGSVERVDCDGVDSVE